MPTRNVVLTDHQSALLDRLVAEGRYQNASEAMREGLRLIEDREASLAGLRTRFAAARRDAEHGSLADGSAQDVLDRVHGEVRARRGEAG